MVERFLNTFCWDMHVLPRCMLCGDLSFIHPALAFVPFLSSPPRLEYISDVQWETKPLRTNLERTPKTLRGGIRYRRSRAIIPVSRQSLPLDDKIMTDSLFALPLYFSLRIVTSPSHRALPRFSLLSRRLSRLVSSCGHSSATRISRRQ